MKTRIFLLAFVVGFFCFSGQARAGIPILYQSGDDVVKVIDLPSEYTIEMNGKTLHADLGIKHEQFSIFYIPLWNYGEEKYVLYNKTSSSEFAYVELSSSDIEYLQSQFSDIPTTPELSFWNTIGGKLLFGFIVILVFYFGGEVGEIDIDD